MNDREHQWGMDAYARPTSVADTNSFLSSVFSWMTAGLLLTGVVGWYVYDSGLIDQLRGAFMVIFLLQLGLVFGISAGINRMTAGTATGLFLLYSALMGVTLSSIFAIYDMGSIGQVLLMTSVLFGVLAVFGKTTTIDLSRIGSIAFAALIAIIIASLLNVFLFKSGAMQNVISVIGVIVFAGLTAWDMQRLTQMASAGIQGSEMVGRMVILGALSLYLDFINMFLFLLRLFGGRRD
ncbi:MAG TPA: Bax inhibitor-1/YccA family protein [Armatimonadota bacterium]|nr:Bax inhibitor-1/YccA family protein [Armatimonadota bacterium]